MRITIFLIIVSSTIAFGTGTYSQVAKLSVKLKDVTVKEAIKTIEEKSEFIFFYQDRQIDLNRKISMDFNEEEIEVILNRLFKGTKNIYIIRDRQIIVYERKLFNYVKPEAILENAQPEKPATGSGSIRGTVTDERGLPMIGATIVVDGTTIGTIADMNGHYQLLAVPAGKQIIKFSFVGYNTISREVELERGDVLGIDIKMSMSQVELLEVVAYGQARGQLAAINQQLRASGIVNVVSAEKLQELPDVNVAEAIGRLPGLMVERNRGEGQKIIIRGLQPKYNTISIGGNMVPSTSLDDRSTDLNMISPEILGGVEVLKANTADKDADGLGGTVNLTLREAPAGLKINAGIMSGYSSHSKSISNHKAFLHASNRFFKNKLGVMLTGNADLAERNSDHLVVSYNVQGVPKYDQGQTFIQPWVTNMELQANIEARSRAGGSLLLDWKVSPSTTIKLSNFLGYLHRDIADRIKTYEVSLANISMRQEDNIVNQLLYSNALEAKHIIFGSELEWGASRSESNNVCPYRHRVRFINPSAYNGYVTGKTFDLDPPELIPAPENVNDAIDRYYFYDGRFYTYKANETETSLFLNLKTPYKFGQHISGFIKTGFKYREKNRYKRNTTEIRRLDSSSEIALFRQAYPDAILTTTGAAGSISILNFLDENYKPNDFLVNQYELLSVSNVIDRSEMSNLYEEYLKAYYYYIPAGVKDDYDNYESVMSGYIMTELNIGKYLTFIPGIRYEKTDVNYTAYIADELRDDWTTPAEIQFRDTTGYNNYYNILPQVHLRIKPTEWFDIRLAYTNTLSRPDYNQLAPYRHISVDSRTVRFGDTDLKPALSENYDLIFSFYKQRFGLFTLGAFYKDIENFLWRREALVVAGTLTDPVKLRLPPDVEGFTAIYPLNNINKSTIKGLEMDIQSNLDFLPIKGFVFNMNLTLMDSETKYSQTLIERALNPDYGVVPGAPRVIFINRDTAYVDRLLLQPGYLANIGLGYDNRKIGLSVRLSFSYQDDILTKEQRRIDAADKEKKMEFYRWDFQLNQRITKKLSFNANMANIFNQPDKSIRLITGYLTDLEYYGMTAQIGLKYNFF